MAGAGNPPSSSSSSSAIQRSFSGLGIAFLALITTVLLACYVCRRVAGSLNRAGDPNAAPDRASALPGDVGGLPRIVLVAEGGDVEAAAAAAAGRSPVRGLDQAAINSYPKFPYSRPPKAAGGADAVCPICLCEYREGEMLRVMPGCLHGFHRACVDAWLRLNASCPVCRTSPVPTPPSTPLSELVPLSHFSADQRRR